MQTNHNYPLEYIDLLATITLSPNNVNLDKLTPSEIKKINSYLQEENCRIQSAMKNHIFTVNKKKEVELLVRHYYTSTINIIDIVVDNREKLPPNNDLEQIYDSLLNLLNDLLVFIESRFGKYLSAEEKVANTYLLMAKERLKQKLAQLQKRFNRASLNERSPLPLLFKRLQRFIKRAEEDFEVTLRTLLYKKELIKGLEEMDIEAMGKDAENIFTEVDKLLIYLNYNSKTYIDDLTFRIFGDVNTLSTAREKLDRLLYHRKSFKQLHRKPGFILNPNYHDLDMVLDNWFDEEIGYWERYLALSSEHGKVPELVENRLSVGKGQISKVLINLSADQISLILRGADEARIFAAKSMSQIFKTIIPHLSTPNRTNLSYDAMRGKSYVAEERDKEIAIEALEKIIRKIRDY